MSDDLRPPLILPLDAVQALAMTGERLSCLDGSPALWIDLEPAQEPIAIDIVLPWLQELGCPVIGVGAAAVPAHAEIAEACDVGVASLVEAQALLGSLHKAPMAAFVLVQLLRRIGSMDLATALLAESLAYSTLQAGPEHRRWLALRPAGPAVATATTDQGPAVVIDTAGADLQLWLNRPANRNAMSMEMRDGLVDALMTVLATPAQRTIRIAARGRCFSTGGALNEFGMAPDPVTAHLVRSLALPGRLLAECADRCTVTVHGACIGSGIEFPAFAGRVEARADAWFQLPELGMGLIPGAGGCVSISRRIGRQRTAWMLLSGRRVNAETALEWGLIDALIP